MSVNDERLIFDGTIVDKSKKQSYSAFVFGCLTTNYIIGTGVLGLPHSFSIAGIRLSIITCVLVGLISYIAFMYLAEAMARADALNDILEGQLSSSLVDSRVKFEIGSRK
ncbi:hypothetical protein P9112_007260 [Eukaryota sp. TZLM1-RC]